MTKIVTGRTFDGQTFAFVDEIIGSGAMKDVYFSPDRAYVVAFYKSPQDDLTRERLQMIAGRYRESIFEQIGGDYWRNLFCWPTAILEHAGRLGFVAPAYPNHFFFAHGSRNHDMLGIRGKEKQGKWFATASLRNRFIDPRELGDWRGHLFVCLRLARAVRRLHMAGLAHSDLSYRNVLIDPSEGWACVIDIDGLVVPGKYPPDVVGTPDFIAPEVVMTSHLARDDPARRLPRRETDLHALAVLIYLYLLYRHPLRGGKIHDPDDPQRDERLAMGEGALFIEHPDDPGNRIRRSDVRLTDLPWADTDRLPFTLTGPYLAPLFRQAFVEGLHDPAQRPSANDWETALIKTLDLLLPCPGSRCEQKWYVFDNSTQPCCPFCGTPFPGLLPVLNFYSSRQAGQFRTDHHRLLVWPGQSLFLWHANSLIAPNEKLAGTQQTPVGQFVFDEGCWSLVNTRLPELMDLATQTPVPLGGRLALSDGQRILLSREDGGRLVVVQMIAPK